MPTVFEVFIRLHCFNIVGIDVEQKCLSVRMEYRTGNIIGLVLKSVVTTWSALLLHVGTESLSTYLLSYTW